jgi:hypothetical protein
MSMTFKISIPKGELFKHLDGRDGRSRNFEVIRLATNALLGNGSIPTHPNFNRDVVKEETGVNNQRANEDKKGERTIASTLDIEESMIGDEGLNNEEIVDFGSSLLNL